MDVYLEIGNKRVFACAVDWPGWCRSGRDEQQAIEALVAYAPRYAAVAEKASLKLPKDLNVRIVERIAGNATTDFGAPGLVPAADKVKLTSSEVKRTVALLEAAWATLDEVVAGAPAALRKGPRGGGRDRDKIVEHVLDAENGYARAVGVKAKEDERRQLLVEAIGQLQTGERRWPPRYVARRTAWHALDHAWEIEDRSEN